MAGGSETMITVKKHDGTVVRMTLSDFKEYRESQRQANSAIQAQPDDSTQLPTEQSSLSQQPPVSAADPVPADEEPQESHALVAAGHQELATTTPVPDAFVNEAKAAWEAADHKSLLDEEIGEQDMKIKKQDVPTIPSRDAALLNAVVMGLSFPVPEEIKGRLQSLIESRIKDIRTDDDVLAYGIRSADEGGLGLSEEQSQTLLETILDTLHLAPSNVSADHEPEQKNEEEESQSQQKSVEPVALPEKKSSPFSYDAPSRDEMPWQPRFPTVSVSQPTGQPAMIPSTRDGRPLVHDVQPPAARTMGPIDEFRAFTLADLHRLGGSQDQMSAAMIEKFHVLRDESFVLYLDAIDAFRQSPFYRSYQAHLTTAINEEIPLETSLEYDEEGMTMQDIECMVNIMKAIGY